jgi:hypothetical protein
MDTGAFVFEMAPTSRARKTGAAAHAVVLFLMATGVSGVLCFNTLRVGDSNVEHRDDLLLREFRSGETLRGSVLVGAGAESCPPLNDPLLVKACLPAGAIHDVLVTGQLFGRLEDRAYGSERRAFLAYAFQMAYQSTIEANDGRTVVELRRYGQIQMAKLISPVQGMVMRRTTLGERPLHGISFRSQDRGICAASVQEVAQSLLSKGSQEAIACTHTRAYAEQDPLSNAVVRLTYQDGRGVTALEIVEGTFTRDQVDVLARQQLLSRCYLLPRGGCGESSRLLPVEQLIGFLDPTRLPGGGCSFKVCPRDGAGRLVCDVYRPIPDLVSGMGSDGWEQTPAGTVWFDPSASFVSEATMRWEVWELFPCSYYSRLWFEDAFQTPTTLTAHYQCVRR